MAYTSLFQGCCVENTTNHRQRISFFKPAAISPKRLCGIVRMAAAESDLQPKRRSDGLNAKGVGIIDTGQIQTVRHKGRWGFQTASGRH